MNNFSKISDQEKLKGKTAIVTGATAGIGLATAKALAGMGAHVIGVGRSAEKCRFAEQMIKIDHPGALLSFHIADLSSQRQIKSLTKEIKTSLDDKGFDCLDILINNAGTFSSWFTTTSEGFELQFAVNHLAPFLLTHELFRLLLASPESRIITVSSGSHYRAHIRWNDVQLSKHYNPLSAYRSTKLANVLFTAELVRRAAKARLSQSSSGHIRAFAADPGLVNTDIGLKSTIGLAKWIWTRRKNSGTNPENGAATSIFLASAPVSELTDDIYWKDCKPKKPSANALREADSKRLWELSEKLCSLKSEDYAFTGF